MATLKESQQGITIQWSARMRKDFLSTICKKLKRPFVHINMGRYRTKEDISALIGASPHLRGGGKDDVNELLTPLRKSAADSPDGVAECVVLLDEIEKADKSCLSVLMEPFDFGTFKTYFDIIDCHRTVFILTTNAGQELVMEHAEELREHNSYFSVPVMQFQSLFRTTVMNYAFEVHCNGFTRRVSHIIPFLPLSVAELEDAATVQLLSKRKSAFKAWGLVLGDEAALELISSGSFEDTKARLKILDATLGASMAQNVGGQLGGKGIGRHAALIRESLDGELTLKFSQPRDEKEFSEVVQRALSPDVKAVKKNRGWDMQEEDNDSRKNEVVAHRAPSESVSDAPKLRTRKRPPKKLTISAERTLTSPSATGHGASSRKRSETGNLCLSTLTRQATLSPSRPRLEAASFRRDLCQVAVPVSNYARLLGLLQRDGCPRRGAAREAR